MDANARERLMGFLLEAAGATEVMIPTGLLHLRAWATDTCT